MVTRGITLKQPWSQAVIFGGKNIENRTWSTKFRGSVAIHAGLAYDDYFTCFTHERDIRRRFLLGKRNMPKGHIIGVVDIVDCVTESSSKWFEGPYGFVLANPRSIEPIPFRGKLSIYNLPPDVIKAINNQLKKGA